MFRVDLLHRQKQLNELNGWSVGRAILDDTRTSRKKPEIIMKSAVTINNFQFQLAEDQRL